MKDKINIAELLKDCPKGMELDCALYDNVFFDGIDTNDDNFPISLYYKHNNIKNGFSVTKYGTYYNHQNTKCIIFPKGKTTWDGFQRPFKDGDIVFTHANCLKVGLGNTWISIYQENRNGGVATYVDYAEDGSDYYSDIDGDKPLLCMDKDIMRQRFATEAEKEKLFDAIKANGYKWNEKTKTLDKLITPKKFDITTLKSFDKVLVRCSSLERWHIDFFEAFDGKNKYPFTCLHNNKYSECIPYEGNEHLLGTTNDCDEYYKTW